MTKDSVRVGGVWLVKTPSHLGNKIEVLVEVDGQWRRAISEVADDGPISHIAEPAGLRTAPVAETTETPVSAALINLAEEWQVTGTAGQHDGHRFVARGNRLVCEECS